MVYGFHKVAIVASLTLSFFIGLSLISEQRLDSSNRRRLSVLDPKSVLRKPRVRKLSSQAAQTWCGEEASSLPSPLEYDQCNADDIIYRIPLFGGMTNALKLVLLGAIQSFQEGRCFFVDEAQANLNTFDRKNYHDNGFIQRYFAKIGLHDQDVRVRKALKENRIRSLTWKELWVNTEVRRMFNSQTSIASLGIQNMENHDLKKLVSVEPCAQCALLPIYIYYILNILTTNLLIPTQMMRRMWRPKPEVRERTCRTLQEYGLLDDKDFMTFSIRRGDKSTEQFDFITMQDYVEAAEDAVQHKFDGKPPTVFVATDDCSVLPTLRTVRPGWRFVSECDRTVPKENEDEGFALSAMGQWSNEETDDHFSKFFVELYAMALSKEFIGVAYTNVAWWAFFMRTNRDSFRLLDAGENQQNVLDAW